jgi:hypothetical protein
MQNDAATRISMPKCDIDFCGSCDFLISEDGAAGMRYSVSNTWSAQQISADIVFSRGDSVLSIPVLEPGFRFERTALRSAPCHALICLGLFGLTGL